MVDILISASENVIVFCFQYNFPKTIVDSGTTDLRLPNKVYTSVIDHIKNYVQVITNISNNQHPL